MEKRLMPALTRKFRLTDFRRGNEKWKAPIAKLKLHAEQAKIDVCRKGSSSEIWIDDLCKDDSGRSVDFEYQLTPAEVEEIVAPYVTRSLNLYKKALQEKGLSGADIEKVLMIGGTTLIPCLRDRVREELGVTLEFSIDPITVVARGAAIFAGAQPWRVGQGEPVPAGAFRIELEYEPMGSDTDPPVGGRVHHPDGENLQGYSIEFVEAKTEWRSGKIPLAEEGTFTADIHAEKGRKCEFHIELCDPGGTRQETVPDRFPYTIGMVIDSPPLIHSVGVAMANNLVDLFIDKGTPLPARDRNVHRTVYALRAGQAGDLINIPVVEGENFSRADRNRLIGKVEIPSDKIRRDVPAGSEVEITIHIDESRLVTAKAYIPVLDEEFDNVIKLEKDPASPSELRESLKREKRRLSEGREKAGTMGDLKAEEALTTIDHEQMLEQVESLLEAAEGDPDAVTECENRLLDLKAAVDKVQDALEWPTLVEEAEDRLKETHRLVNAYGKAGDKSRLRTLESDLRKAIDSGIPDLTRRQSDEVHSLGIQVLALQPGFWVGYLDYIEGQKSKMRDRAQAEQLIAQGRLAINNNDVEGLQAVVRQLIGLLPAPDQEKARGYGGGTIL